MKKYLIMIILVGISFYTSAVETIRFATEASYPPFEFIDINNEIQGFDVDIVKALCKEMQVKYTLSNQAFDSLIPGLKFKRFDAMIASIDITPERTKQLLFTKPYYSNSALFVYSKGILPKDITLKNKKVGVQNGTTHQKYLADKHPEIIAIPYDNYQNAIMDLKSGRVDAVFGDTAVVHESLKHNADIVAGTDKITDQDYFGSGLAIALDHPNNELQSKFNAALDKIKQDTSYAAIYKKWFLK